MLEGYGKAAYARAVECEVILGKRRKTHEWNGLDMPVTMVTDCKSAVDNLSKQNSMCDCRQTALYVASLKQLIEAGAQADRRQATCRWVPTRHMKAEGMTKAGFSKELRDFMATGGCRFHEASAQEQKRQPLGVQYFSLQDDEDAGEEASFPLPKLIINKRW